MNPSDKRILAQVLRGPGRWVELSDTKYFVPSGHTCWLPDHQWEMLDEPLRYIRELKRMGRGGEVQPILDTLNAGRLPGVVCGRCGISAFDYERWSGTMCLPCNRTIDVISKLQMAYYDLPALIFAY